MKRHVVYMNNTCIPEFVKEFTNCLILIKIQEPYSAFFSLHAHFILGWTWEYYLFISCFKFPLNIQNYLVNHNTTASK